jgi:hypothetical protein
MNDGVALLLERMKTHPEEFISNSSPAYSKWNRIIGEYKEYLEPEDKEILRQGINKILQQRFTEEVMKELIDPKLENPYLTEPSVTRLGAQTPIQYTADKLETLGQTPIAGVTQTL